MTKDLPLIVTSVKDHGAELGVEVGWRVDAIAGEPIVEGQTFDSVLELLRIAVAHLPES